ncbi:hypothetical protein ENBRE01_1242 [Enteropsectra breve]|nr:hypothetical protein ENBRE01_1242 [Enteropsectra breve]
MSKKTDKLTKYLEKKKTQARRDDLLHQIKELSKNPITKLKPAEKPRKKTRKAKASDFEKIIFSESSATKAEAHRSDNAQWLSSANGEDFLTSVEPGQLDHGDAGQNLPHASSTSFKHYEISTRNADIENKRKELEVYYQKYEIISHIKNNLISFIEGETGSGKSTQIPQFLLEAGFSENGLIGMTQPRRISAIGVSERINVELNENFAGYAIKYASSVTDNTKIKVMTEGILLREISNGFLLQKYTVILLDEVHERSGAIDVIIGLLSKIISLRATTSSPLRLCLMSATANCSAYSQILQGIAPFKIRAKKHHVGVFYEATTDNDYKSAIFKKIMEILSTEKPRYDGSCSDDKIGDGSKAILVFLPSKSDIYTLKNTLETSGKNIKILPLHSGLSKAEQAAVYKHYNCRKVILSTNIAETSITIDDVVYVIDSGRAKYKVSDESSLKYYIDFISKSSAKQRMGRAGRVMPGVCFRMYSGDTFESFREDSIPGIFMEPLDGLVLQLKALGIAKIENFPFISPVRKENIDAAVKNLQGLGILTGSAEITPIGNYIARINITPKVGRLLCMKNTEDVYYELSVVAAALHLGFELRKTKFSEHLFYNAGSDLIVFLRAFKDYIKAHNRGDFCKRIGISPHSMEEVHKLAAYLFKQNTKQLAERKMPLDEQSCEKICKCIYFAFSDNIALFSGDVHVYRNGDVRIDGNSIESANNHIVFEHIVCGKSHEYAKNITIVKKEWLKMPLLE